MSDQKEMRLDWVEFKSKIIGVLPYKHERSQSVPGDMEQFTYEIFAFDRDTIWLSTLTSEEDKSDFEQNYMPESNKVDRVLSSDGLDVNASFPGIDPKNMCFCQGSAGKVSVATPFIEWPVPFASVQLTGMTLWVENAEKYDKMDFEVGYYHPVTEEWVCYSKYGYEITAIVASFYFHKEASRASNPIPQGLYLRIAYAFKNPSTENQPDVSAVYHLQRPYAQ